MRKWSRWALRLVLLCTLLAGTAIWVLVQPIAVQAQETPTSTPDAEGNIYVVVQPNDSLWSIAARAGLSLPELLELNGITESTVLQPGDLLLIGRGAPPATPTSDIPTATLPPPTLTPTTIPARTAICLTAFEDTNQDGILNPGEPLRAEVAFTVFNDQTVVSNYISDGVSEPYCLENLEPGTYHITRSIARDETLTTEGDWALTLTYGNELNLAFGSYRQSAQSGSATPDSNAQFATRIAGTPVPQPAVEEGGAALSTSPLIIVLLGIGLIALLLGVAVLLFWFAYGRNEKS
jgi:hypothetical protein